MRGAIDIASDENRGCAAAPDRGEHPGPIVHSFCAFEIVRQSGLRYNREDAAFYVSVNIDAQVAIFEQRRPHYEVGAIFNLLFPSSVELDAERNIYVADQLEDTIDVFKQKALEPTTSLYDSGEPIDVKSTAKGRSQRAFS